MLWWTIQNVLVTAMLCGIVWSASRLLRIGPVARHALWLIVLIKFLTPPLVVWPWAIPASPVGAESPLISADRNPRADARTSARGYDSEPDQSVASYDIAITPAESQTDPPAPVVGSVPHENKPSASWLHLFELLLPIAGSIWLTGAVAIAVLQLSRILLMRHRVRYSTAAPPELLARVRELSERLGIRPVRTRLVSGIGSPLIWSLTKPQLLWPAELDPSRMRGESIRGLILHELAHVRRHDHWVGWLELAAGCLWWWNPLFWYVRHQLRENAELACDGWVVQTLPGGRRAYAEALVWVCEFISGRTNPMPAVGVSTGGRRFLERRLAMILREQMPLRLSRAGLLVLGLLAATAVPVWSQKSPADSEKPAIDLSAGIAESRARVNVAARDADSSPRESDDRRLSDPAGTDSLRADVVGRLQTLRDLYARDGRDDDVRAVTQALAALSRPSRSSQVRADPGNLMSLRGHDGRTYIFSVVGSTEGAIWGSGEYTDDSPLAVAAVHAGVATPGHRTLVKVTILPGRQNYEGSTRNGIESASYGSWPGSYRVEPVVVAFKGEIAPGDRVVLKDPGTLLDYRNRRGQSFTLDVTGSDNGTIWGDGIYTDDSPLAVAAVHAGVLQPGERGRVRVTILPGQASYEGSTRHGVSSQSYGPFDGSYRIEGLARRLLPDGTVTPTLEHLRDQVGRTFRITVTGSTEGGVWGSGDVYTDDSSLPAAAVHAGVLRPGERGTVTVTILPGRDHYEGSTANGVTSGSWDSWHGSYRIDPAGSAPRSRTY